MPSHHTVERVSGEERFLPILQHVALSNKHVNHPNMGPYILADAEPLDSGGVEATKKAFFACVERGLYNGADRHFLWLWDHIPHGEALDVLLTVAIPKNTLDDHYFIFPMFTWRALDWLGREYTPFLMRPAVRYVAGSPLPPVLTDIEPLLDEYELLTRPLGFHTSPEETPAIGELGEAITRCDRYAELPRMIAKALADGLSLQGTGEALSIGAAGLFMRSLTGNPMDVHLHTGANLRRYLLKVEGVSLRNKLLALLTWHTGPEVRSTQNRMEPPPGPGSGGRGRATSSQPGGSAGCARGEHLHPAADRLVEGHQSRSDARGARGQEEHREPRAAVCQPRIRPGCADQPPRRDRRARQLHRDARLQAPSGDRGGVSRHPAAVAVAPSRERGPGVGHLLRRNTWRSTRRPSSSSTRISTARAPSPWRIVTPVTLARLSTRCIESRPGNFARNGGQAGARDELVCWGVMPGCCGTRCSEWSGDLPRRGTGWLQEAP